MIGNILKIDTRHIEFFGTLCIQYRFWRVLLIWLFGFIGFQVSLSLAGLLSQCTWGPMINFILLISRQGKTRWGALQTPLEIWCALTIPAGYILGVFSSYDPEEGIFFELNLEWSAKAVKLHTFHRSWGWRNGLYPVQSVISSGPSRRQKHAKTNVSSFWMHGNLQTMKGHEGVIFWVCNCAKV